MCFYCKDERQSGIFRRWPWFFYLSGGVDFMIRYSSYGSTNRQTPSRQIYLDPLEVEYRELEELRERVRKAEAAAERRKRHEA